MNAGAVPGAESRVAASREGLEAVVGADRAPPRRTAMEPKGLVRQLGGAAEAVGVAGQDPDRVGAVVSGATSAQVGHGERKR